LETESNEHDPAATILAVHRIRLRSPCRSLLESRSDRLAQLTKGNETPTTLVPKYEAHTVEALKQREPAHAAKFGMFAQCQRQAIIENADRQVVDMVHADVGREPTQDPWQGVMRAAMQGRLA